MDLAVIGVILSFLALGVAGLALWWNMSQFNAPGARIRMGVEIKEQPGSDQDRLKGKYVSVSVLNMGPNNIEIQSLWAAKISFFRRLFLKGSGILLKPVANFQLPSEVKAGETVDLLVPFHEECFLRDGYDNIGIIDAFDREHFVPKSQVAAIRRQFEQSFG